MLQRTWMSVGTLPAAVLWFVSCTGTAGSLSPPIEERQPARTAQPVASRDEGRPLRPQQEADYLQLHRHLQQLMKDRRQYRNDLQAGGPAERLQADREAIKRAVKLARQVRLRIQENSRNDRYRQSEATRRLTRFVW